MIIEKEYVEKVAEAMRDEKKELTYKGLRFFMDYDEDMESMVVREATHIDPEECKTKVTYDIREVEVYVITRSKNEEDMLLGVFDGHEMAILEKEVDSGVWL